MKWNGTLLLILSLFICHVTRAQDDESFDFSDLDKVEQEEFGNETNVDENSDFDLNVEPKKNAAPDTSTAQDDLEDEFKELEGEGTDDINSQTVDLDKALEEESPQKQEALPPLETPQENASEQVPPPDVPESEALPEEQATLPEPETAPEVAQPEEPIVPPVQDEPNEQFEARLNRIYQKYMTHPTPEEEWTKIVGEKISETYAIQPGDTLWDISVTFFGNGNFWPKVWQLNDEITNPHSIRPGRVIRFTPGTLESAPEIQVTDSGAGQILAQGSVTPEVVPLAEPVIPPTDLKIRPVLKKLPPSLPKITFESKQNYDEAGFSLERKGATVTDPLIDVTSYLSEEAPVSLGKIVGVELEGATTASTYQYLFIKSDQVSIGDKLTVYQTGRMVEYKGDKYGVPIQFGGTIEVLERANDGGESVYKAMVTQTVGQISIGDALTRDPIPKVLVSESGRPGQSRGEIIGGQFDNKRDVLGQQSIVYLDIGSSNGVQVGDVLGIIKNESIRNKEANVTVNSKKIGALKIAKTTATRSTGIILSSEDRVMPGDIVGAVSEVARSTVPQENFYEPSAEEETIDFDDGEMDFENESNTDFNDTELNEDLEF